MTIEITLYSGKKAVLNREHMTFSAEGKTCRLAFWPIVEQDGVQICDNSAVASWKEITDVKPLVPKLSVLPCPSISGQAPITKVDEGTTAVPISMPDSSRVPDRETDWIK